MLLETYQQRLLGKILRFRFFVVFGLWGPFLGPGAAGNRPRMKNCVRWTPGGVQGPILSGFWSGSKIEGRRSGFFGWMGGRGRGLP